MVRNTQMARWTVFFAVTIATLFLLTILPTPLSSLLLCGLLVLATGIAVNRFGYSPSTYPALVRRWIRRLYDRYIMPMLAVGHAFVLINQRHITTIEASGIQLNERLIQKSEPIVRNPARSIFLTAAEITSILLMAGFATHSFYTSGGLQLSGREAEWLTSSGYAAHDGLRDYGRIPLWQPYLEFGEPLIDNPFSFVLNPFSSLPSLLFGGAEGMKMSVVITTALAGLGGWFLGQVLGFGPLGRVLLGMLLVGKGNMFAMFNTGFFQLAASQAYFPWIIAGITSIFFYPHRRWPPVLLAISAALLWFAGNIWYTLPMFICAGVIAIVYLIRPKIPAPNFSASLISRISSLRRLLFAGILTFGISAATLLPVWINQGQIGKHPPEIKAGVVVPLWKYVIPFYTNQNHQQKLDLFDPAKQAWEIAWTIDKKAEFYYSFVVPTWFLVLISLAIPLYRPRWNRLWWITWLFIAFFTLWGAGGQPLFLWLYEHIAALRGWRFVGRALAVGSFWIAVLVAMRADSLWQIIISTRWQEFGLEQHLAWRLPRVLGGILLIGSALAAYQVIQQWHASPNNILNPIYPDDVCVSWLRAQYPDRSLAIWRYGYEGVTTLINNRVRIFDITADFEMSPMPHTTGTMDLTRSLPEFAIPWQDKERAYLRRVGYVPVLDSPRLLNTKFPCLYRKANTLSYAYTVSLTTLQATKSQTWLPYGNAETLSPESTKPITVFQRQPDNILLTVNGDPMLQTILTVQERAYPGWRVEIDGNPAKLQSVGGQIGVFVPSGPGLHTIYFEYRPHLFIIGAWITLIASLFAILYLLHADRFLPDIFRHERHNSNGVRSEN